MNEEEAKTKWCPMVRFYVAGNQVCDNKPGNGANTACIASGCMMWRWNDSALNRVGQTKPLGYCGLAGKP